MRLKRVSIGNFGDVKPIGEGLSELRFDIGAGYRIYFMQRGKELIILLGGSDKNTQQKTIDKVKDLSTRIKNGKIDIYS